MQNCDEAYQEAYDSLVSRFGDPFVLASAFRAKLDAWPRISNRDGPALRKLVDYLKQCRTAMKSNRSLLILDDESENQKFLSKLPDWLVQRWARMVSESRTKDGKFPTFSEIVDFISKKEKIAKDSVTNMQAFKPAAQHASSQQASLR